MDPFTRDCIVNIIFVVIGKDAQIYITKQLRVHFN